MSHPLPPKKEVALALLERSRVHVHLDPRKEGVLVPISFKKQPQLVLEIGLNMPVPIPDLVLNDEGMFCTLSFSRQPFYCVVPWPSIFAMVGEDGRGMVWPDDVPPEIATQATVRAPEQPAPRARPAAAKRVLEPVRSGPAAASEDAPDRRGREHTRAPRPRRAPSAARAARPSRRAEREEAPRATSPPPRVERQQGEARASAVPSRREVA
jgi:stringent starvation protein B